MPGVQRARLDSAAGAGSTHKHAHTLSRSLALLLYLSLPHTQQVYSAHDSTVLPVLVALGTSFRGWPPYSSRIELQLLREAGTKEVPRVWGVGCRV